MIMKFIQSIVRNTVGKRSHHLVFLIRIFSFIDCFINRVKPSLFADRTCDDSANGYEDGGETTELTQKLNHAVEGYVLNLD